MKKLLSCGYMKRFTITRIPRTKQHLMLVFVAAVTLATAVVGSWHAGLAYALTCPPTGATKFDGSPWTATLNGNNCLFSPGADPATGAPNCGPGPYVQVLQTFDCQTAAVADTPAGGGNTGGGNNGNTNGGGTQTCGNAKDHWDATLNQCVHNATIDPATGTAACETGYTPIGQSLCGTSSQNSVPNGTGGTTASDAQQQPDLCPVPVNATFRWASCWLINGMVGLLNLLNDLLTTMMTIDTGQIFGSGTGQTINDPGTPVNGQTSGGFYQAWSVFRNVGVGIVVIAAILMVMSEALNLQIVDALTVRRSLPKIGVVVFLIIISWPLTYYLITASNRIGHGMASIIYSSFSSVNPGANGENAFAHFFKSLLVAGGALAAFGFIGILGFASAIIVGIVLVLIMLLLRQGVIIMAVIIAPLALACYALPNTARFTKFWWDTFLKALIAFPLMTGIIAIGKVMALISQSIFQ